MKLRYSLVVMKINVREYKINFRIVWFLESFCAIDKWYSDFQINKNAKKKLKKINKMKCIFHWHAN